MERFTDTLPEGIPAAAALIEELRATDDLDERAAIVARYPVLEQLAPVPGDRLDACPRLPLGGHLLDIKERRKPRPEWKTHPDGI